MSWWRWLVVFLFGSAACAAIGWQTLSVRNLQRRVAALEATASSHAATAELDEAAREARRKAFEAAIEERVAESLKGLARKQQGEREERATDVVRTTIRAWADHQGLDEATTARLEAELEERFRSATALRQDVRDGALTIVEAREEADVARAESDAALEQILGREKFVLLEQELLARLAGGGQP